MQNFPQLIANIPPPSILSHPKLRYRVYSPSQLTTILSHMYPVPDFQCYSSKFHFNIILLPMPIPTKLVLSFRLINQNCVLFISECPQLPEKFYCIYELCVYGLKSIVMTCTSLFIFLDSQKQKSKQTRAKYFIGEILLIFSAKSSPTNG